MTEKSEIDGKITPISNHSTSKMDSRHKAATSRPTDKQNAQLQLTQAKNQNNN
jgi:hypothetical protein